VLFAVLTGLLLCGLSCAAELIIYGCTVHARYRPERKDGKGDAPIDLHAPPHASFTSASSQYLQLSTSRQTNIVPRALLKAGASAASIPLRSEFLRHPMYLRPSELSSLSKGAEFDLVCVVLSVQDGDEQPELAGNGAVQLLKQRRLLCAGMGGDLLLIQANENRENREHIYFSAIMSVPQLVTVENLSYQSFEKKFQLHIANATAVTHFKPKGAIPLAKADFAAVVPSHALFHRPTIALFQSWLTSPLIGQLHGLLNQFGMRLLSGEWGGGQGITFNQDDFAKVRSTRAARHK
jgi:hypothetical protein